MSLIGCGSIHQGHERFTQIVKLFEATDKNLHTGLSKEDLGDILAEIDDLKVTYKCVDGKLLHVN
ncbi:hypothetical protein P5673_018027 [Acropora cervicornis]|uniref:Uncharacterized protein n=1 Tax=Acropora cervicornis TaxID=6130 RepID=A0AAD9QDY8_ACRCE|nr:hypothetical protein P5673_018027 [Acropora cervicornis]